MHKPRRNYTRITVWAVIAPFVVLLLFSFVLGPLILSEPHAYFLINDVGQYFLYYLILLVVTLALRDFLVFRN
jgi:hypothetical protein